ncbi:MAG: NrsF family protein, partial [Hyphomonadaceae bacterium]
MKTSDLIEALSRSDYHEATRAPPRWAGAAAIGFVAAVLLIMTWLGPRPDLGAAIAPTLAKALFSGLFAAAGLALTARLARPGRPAGSRWFLIAALLAFSALAAGAAFLGTDPMERMRVWTGGGFPWCLVFIPLLAIPAALALGWTARRLAPTRLTLAGMGVGAGAGGVGAMAWAVHCPMDSVAYVTTWYALAIALCAVVGALLGARLLRW